MIVIYKPEICNFDRECREKVHLDDTHTGLCPQHLAYYLSTMSPRLQVQAVTPSAPEGPVDAIRTGLFRRLNDTP